MLHKNEIWYWEFLFAHFVSLLKGDSLQNLPINKSFRIYFMVDLYLWYRYAINLHAQVTFLQMLNICRLHTHLCPLCLHKNKAAFRFEIVFFFFLKSLSQRLTVNIRFLRVKTTIKVLLDARPKNSVSLKLWLKHWTVLYQFWKT